MSKHNTDSPTNAEREAKKAVMNACTLVVSSYKDQSGAMQSIRAGRHLISRTIITEEEPLIAELLKTNTN